MRRLFLLLVMLPLALGAPAFAATSGDLATLREEALHALNKSRQAHGLPPLELADRLNTIAQNHVEDMYRHHYYAHTSPQGVTVQDRYLKAGGSKWRLIEENIARCQGCRPPPDKATVTRLQDGWMHSPEHRANILHRGITRFGYGIVVDARQGLYAAQTFDGPGVPRGLKKGETAKAIAPAQAAQAALAAVNRARQKAGAKPLTLSDALNTAARHTLPANDLDSFHLHGKHDLFGALPRGEKLHWRAIAALAGACGGCGVKPTDADVRFFVKDWLGQAGSKQRLTAKRFTALGFALAANGKGKKVAFVLLGEAR